MLETVERALAGQRSRAIGLSIEFAEKRSEHRVAAQLVMVDQILVAKRQAEHPLRHQRLHPVHDEKRIARIPKAGRKPINELDRPIRFREQQGAAVRRHHPAVEIRHYSTAASPSEIDLARVTLRRHRGPPSNRVNSLSLNKFSPLEAPMRRSRVRNPG